jgi:restriction endonuclease Mrr
MHKEDHVDDDDQIYKQLIDEVDKYAKKMAHPMRGYGHPHPSAMTPAVDWPRIEYEGARKRLNDYVKGLKRAQDSDLLFENTNDNDTIAPLVLDVNDELKKYFAKHPEALYEISPRKFEMLIADILRDFGFDVEITSATRDGGKDIFAYWKSQICNFLMYVECKRWHPKQHVGIEVVQRLYGVQQIDKANKSMIVTTSFFTKPAIEEWRRYKNLMDLKDYNDLKEWLKRYE